MAKVLITGGTGFVGRHLALLASRERPHNEVLCVSRRTNCDLRDYEAIRQVVEHFVPDQIHHLAAQAFVPESGLDPHRALDVNARATLNLMQAVRNTGSRAHVHVAGTSEEYGYEHTAIDELTGCTPQTIYGASKLAASTLALAYGRQYGIPVVVTRAFNHTGPGQPAVYAVSSFALRVALYKAGVVSKILHGNLAAMRDYTDVRDIAAAYRGLMLARQTGVYNVASGRVLTLQTVLELLLSLGNVENATLAQDPGLYRPGWQSGPETFPTTGAEKLERATGWKPQYAIAQTLSDLLDQWIKEINT